MLSKPDVQLFVNRAIFYLKDQMTSEQLLACVGADRGEFTCIHGNVPLVCAEQMDAMVDIVYYILNTLVKVDDSNFAYCPIFRPMWDGVRQFTHESAFGDFSPVIFNEVQRTFIVRMVLSEIEELCDTVSLDAEESRAMIIEAIHNEESPPDRFYHPMSFLYYIVHLCHVASKLIECVSFEEIFSLVQEANMAKRDPVSGTFTHREDGKVLKPVGWTPPDIVGYVQQSME